MYLAGLVALASAILPFASASPAIAPPKYGYPGGGKGGGHSAGCSYAKKRAAVQAELTTIGSHSLADADKIPLDPLASRTFYVTPNELPEVSLEINVGFTADTVRLELAALALALDAGVPVDSVHFTNNANGTVTSDFIQTDRIALPYVHVREVHYFNDECQISNIVGYVHGDIVCPVDATTLTNSVLRSICTQLVALGLVGQIQPLGG